MSSPSTKRPNSPDPIDIEQLKQVISLEGEEYDKLMRMYMKDTQVQLDRIESAIQKKMAAEIRQNAHAALGASSMLGMTAIAHRLKRLQETADGDDLTEATELLLQTRQEMRRSQSFLSRLKNLS